MNITTIVIPAVIFVILLLAGMGVFAVFRKYVDLHLYIFPLITYITVYC